MIYSVPPLLGEHHKANGMPRQSHLGRRRGFPGAIFCFDDGEKLRVIGLKGILDVVIFR